MGVSQIKLKEKKNTKSTLKIMWPPWANSPLVWAEIWVIS